MNALDFRLLNDFQRDFPLVCEPYALVARTLGVSRDEVLDTLAKLRGLGAISRIGAVFRPNAIGASTLAAMAVPADRLNTVARYVSGFREVNHNYEREHRLNLWFVVTAPEVGRLNQVLGSIEQTTGLDVISLPLLEEFHIDLGFDLHGESKKRVSGGPPPRVSIGPSGQRLVAALQEGWTWFPVRTRCWLRVPGFPKARSSRRSRNGRPSASSGASAWSCGTTSSASAPTRCACGTFRTPGSAHSERRSQRNRP